MADLESYYLPCASELPNDHVSEDERGKVIVNQNAVNIGVSCEYPLPTSPMSPYLGGESESFTTGGRCGFPVGHPYAFDITVPGPAETGRVLSMGVAGAGRELRAPRYASRTLFVEGLPADCTCREVSHIFRPFVGFKEVRLAMKQRKYRGVDQGIHCFVDFQSPGHANIAMDALQGYIIDEHDHRSGRLRLTFSCYPDASVQVVGNVKKFKY